MSRPLNVTKNRRRTSHHAVEAYSYLLLATILVLVASKASFGAGSNADHSAKRITEIVDALKQRFGISNDVHVKIGPNHQLAVSVQPVDERRNEFVLTIDGTFLEQLDDEEMNAAIAHELGHVWIFTHHPYLQTEALANQIAMRVVQRDSLERLYRKLWTFEGTSGKTDELLGPQKASARPPQ